MNYTTYLFDFDYTLVDSSKGIVTCFRNVLNRHGFCQITDEAIKRTIGKTLEDSFGILTGITNPEELTALREEYSKESDIHMDINTFFYPETIPTLTKLKNEGAKIGIISTKHRRRIIAFLKEHLPDGWFDIILGAEDVKHPKPDPEGLLSAIKQLKAAPDHILYIGDSIIDAQAAERADIDFAGVTTGMTTGKELEVYPHVEIIRSLAELAGCGRPRENSPASISG